MAAKTLRLREIKKVFWHELVAEMTGLCLSTGFSRRTVLRYLKEIGHHTSYSHNGRFYALRGIPEFDADGLWELRGIWFSRHGTLRRTACRFVEASETGMTAAELSARLHVRMDNQLSAYVRDGNLAAEQSGKASVYLSPREKRRAAQMAARESAFCRPAPPRPVSLVRVDGISIVSLHGQFDFDVLEDLKRVLGKLAEDRESQVFIDLQPARFVSGQAIRCLLAWGGRFHRRGGSVHVCGASKAVGGVFDLLARPDVVHKFQDRAGALLSCPPELRERLGVRDRRSAGNRREKRTPRDGEERRHADRRRPA